MSEKGTWEKKSCCQGKCLSDWYNAEELLCFLRPQWLLWDSVIRGKVDTGKNKSLLELYLKSDRVYGGEQKYSMKKSVLLKNNKIRHRAELGVAVDKDFCGIGIGRALIAACIDCAKKAGYSQLELEVVSENSHAIALYKSMGFVEFGRNPRGFCSRYQGWQELISMRLELD